MARLDFGHAALWQNVFLSVPCLFLNRFVPPLTPGEAGAVNIGLSFHHIGDESSENGCEFETMSTSAGGND